MVTLDEDTKAKLGQLIDSDGKVMISDDMPEDLKGCLKYLNDNNVSLFSSNPDAYVDDFEPDPFAAGFQDAESDTEVVDDEEDDDVEEEEEVDDNVDDNAVEDLDNVF